jgi:hypothetical protein
MLKLVYGPGGEHDPGEDGVDEEEEGVGDTRGDTAGNLLAFIMNFQDTDVGGAYLLPHFPQALQIAEHVAAPQQVPAHPRSYTAVSTCASQYLGT